MKLIQITSLRNRTNPIGSGLQLATFRSFFIFFIIHQKLVSVTTDTNFSRILYKLMSTASLTNRIKNLYKLVLTKSEIVSTNFCIKLIRLTETITPVIFCDRLTELVTTNFKIRRPYFYWNLIGLVESSRLLNFSRTITEIVRIRSVAILYVFHEKISRFRRTTNCITI
jgi:hypothetical protein